MKQVLALLFVLMAQAAFGQTVVVKSGDHTGFTRLVMELPQVTDWAMGRTGEGYELRLGAKDIRFDLTRVFDDIQRNRLAAIWVDPASGTLRLGIACGCHAIPFEFRPGIIVVDLRDGPPPKGSSFEAALDGSTAGVLAARPGLRPRARPTAHTAVKPQVNLPVPTYTWLPAGNSAQSDRPSVDALLPHSLNSTQHDIGPLKDALLRQLGRGAAQGIVQMTQPSLSARNLGAPLPTGPRAKIHLGEAPGFDVATTRAADNLLIKDGADCVADDSLDVANWGNALPASTQLADARANLIGEFDKPNPDAVILATKLLIHLGFGAEARQLLLQFPVESPDAVLLTSLAKLVDGTPDPDGPFAGMQTCDTAAALWAALALPQLLPKHQPQRAAILRSFSALPAHLRQSLGPDLASRFLAVDDLATAQALTNAVLRGVQSSTPPLALMESGLDLAAGDAVAASARIEPLLPDAGAATAEALIALVDARLAAGQPIDAQTAIALAAFARENVGSPLAPALWRAQILALGASGDFDQAFALLPQMPDAEPQLWALLADAGSEAAVLDHAVLGPDAKLPRLAASQRQKIASQLLALGLAEPALIWIGADAGDDGQMLTAKAKLLAGDAEGALAATLGLTGPDAAALQAAAQLAKQNPAAAAETYRNAGDSDAQLRALSLARDWDMLAKNDASVWQPAAALAIHGPATENLPGPLARGNALIADSAKARATLAALLGQIPRPALAE